MINKEVHRLYRVYFYFIFISLSFPAKAYVAKNSFSYTSFPAQANLRKAEEGNDPLENRNTLALDIPLKTTADGQHHHFFRRFFGKHGQRHRSKAVAAILAGLGFLVGNFGLHRFYLGYADIGILQLLGTLGGIALVLTGLIALHAVGITTGIIALLVLGCTLYLGIEIWGIVDLIRILSGNLRPKDGVYED